MFLVFGCPRPDIMVYFERKEGSYDQYHPVLSPAGRGIPHAPPVKKENDLNQDKWIGVGGKFEDKESPEDCALREIREETGLTATGYRYRGLVTFLSDRWPTEYMHLFTVHSWTGELKECDEGDLEWVPKARLKELPLWDGDHIFLDLLDQDAPFFSLKLSYVGDKLVEAVLNGRHLKGGPMGGELSYSE